MGGLSSVIAQVTLLSVRGSGSPFGPVGFGTTNFCTAGLPPPAPEPTAVVVFAHPAATPGHAERGTGADSAAHQVAPGEPVFVWMHSVPSGDRRAVVRLRLIRESIAKRPRASSVGAACRGVARACMIRAEMRITNVETIVLRLPEIELRADGTQDAFIVRIDTDEGVSGYGEADTSPSVARGLHRHAGLALDARRHARDPARPRSVRHRADLARPLRDDRPCRHARGRDPHDLGHRHRAARPRRPRAPAARPPPARRAASAIASASTRARSCPRRPTRCAGT